MDNIFLLNQIKNFLRYRNPGVISTGYQRLDELLGGGFCRGTMNLVIEDNGCFGHVFLLSILKNRLELEDFGVVECFMPPHRLKDTCKEYNLDFDKYYRRTPLLNFYSRNKIRESLEDDTPPEQIDCNMKEVIFSPYFVEGYIKNVSNLIPNDDVFNIVLSFSDYATMYGEEKVYGCLVREKENYEMCNRTSVYLLERDGHTDGFVDKVKKLFDSVTTLTSTIHEDDDGTTKQCVSVEKSPLKYSREKVGYDISRGNGRIKLGGDGLSGKMGRSEE